MDQLYPILSKLGDSVELISNSMAISAKRLCVIHNYLKANLSFMPDETLKDLSDKEIINKISDSIGRMSRSIIEIDSIIKRIYDTNPKNTQEVLVKEINWFLAINIGTLLWILGNFNKFMELSSDISVGSWIITNKAIFLFIVIILGTSAFIFSIIQAKLYSNQYFFSRKYFILILNANKLKKDWKVFNEYWNRYIIDGERILPELIKKVNELNEMQSTFFDSSENTISTLEGNINTIYARSLVYIALGLYLIGLFGASIYMIYYINIIDSVHLENALHTTNYITIQGGG